MASLNVARYLKDSYVISFLADFIPLAILVTFGKLLLMWFINKNATLDLYSISDFQQLIATNPEAGTAAFQQLKNMYTVLLIGTIIFLVLAVLFYIFSRQYLWKKLSSNVSWKKWLGFFPIVLIAGIVYIAISLLLIISLTSLLKITAISFILQSFFLVLFFMLIFLFHYSLTKKKEIWVSIGNAFTYFKKKSLRKVFGIAFGVSLVLSTLLFLFSTTFPYQFTLNTYLPIIVQLLFIAWFRVYLVENL